MGGAATNAEAQGRRFERPKSERQRGSDGEAATRSALRAATSAGATRPKGPGGARRPPRKSCRMRIVGGRLKGRVLAAPASRATRPTSERLRESIFDILEHRYPGSVEGWRVVDLFAGSGALGN